jgi:lysophospholipase L1-like esterase
LRYGLLALLTIIGVVSGSTAATAGPAFHHYVALGDSWSADSTPMPTMVSTRYVPFGCLQSSGDYPKQVAEALGITDFQDATCGGASTVEMTAPQSVVFGGTNPPQFDRLTPATDLVTLGIGGNDAGLAGAIMGCLNLLPPPLGRPCEASWVSGGVDRMSRNIAESEPKVKAAIAGIRARSPHAKIVLVDYLQGIPATGCWPFVPILNGDVQWLRAKLEELNAMLKRVAAATNVRLAATYRSSAGHDFCRPPGTNWVEGLLPISTTPLGLAAPFHPNQLGAGHQARTVLGALDPNDM